MEEMRTHGATPVRAYAHLPQQMACKEDLPLCNRPFDKTPHSFSRTLGNFQWIITALCSNAMPRLTNFINQSSIRHIRPPVECFQ